MNWDKAYFFTQLAFASMTAVMTITVMVVFFFFPEQKMVSLIVFSIWAMTSVAMMIFQAYAIKRNRRQIDLRWEELKEAKRKADGPQP